SETSRDREGALPRAPSRSRLVSNLVRGPLFCACVECADSAAGEVWRIFAAAAFSLGAAAAPRLAWKASKPDSGGRPAGPPVDAPWESIHHVRPFVCLAVGRRHAGPRVAGAGRRSAGGRVAARAARGAVRPCPRAAAGDQLLPHQPLRGLAVL